MKKGLRTGFNYTWITKWLISDEPEKRIQFVTVRLFTGTIALETRNMSVLKVRPGLTLCPFAYRMQYVFKSGCLPVLRLF
jgi:hypothetical protein